MVMVDRSPVEDDRFPDGSRPSRSVHESLSTGVVVYLLAAGNSLA
jgi:hypothetical protein